MARQQQGDRNKRSHYWLFHPHFAVILGIVCLFEPLMANRVLAQPAATEHKRNDRNAKVVQLLNQAGELNRQGTKESRLKAITLYEEALIIVREIGDRDGESQILYFIGVNYFILNENNRAIEYNKKALVIAQELKKPDLEAAILSSLGGTYSALRKRQLSIDSFTQALLKYRASNKPEYEAQTLKFIGYQYLELGETQKAFNYYKQALDIQTKQKDTTAQAETLISIGSVYEKIGDTEKALNWYKQALKLQKQSGDFNAQAGTLGSIASLYFSLGEAQLSLDLSNQSLESQRALVLQGKLTGKDLTFLLLNQTLTLRTIASTYQSLGNRQKSLSTYNEALSISRQVGNPSAEAGILYQIHILYKTVGELQKALDYLNQALVISRAIDDPRQKADIINSIGDIYKSTGEAQKALNFYNQALEISQQSKDTYTEALILRSIADLYNLLGAYSSSIDTYNTALKLFRETKITGLVNLTLFSIGDAYQDAGDSRKALEYYNLVLSMAQTQKNLIQQSLAFGGIFGVQNSLKDNAQAFVTAKEILSLSRLQKNPLGEALAFSLFGAAYQVKKDNQKAVDFYIKAASQLGELGEIATKAGVLNGLGNTYSASGNQEKAIASFNQALAIYKNLQNPPETAYTLYNIARVERDRNNLAAALTNIDSAIAIIESQRTKVASQDLRTSYFATVQDYYNLKVDLLMQLHQLQPNKGYNAKALETSDRARARSLLETLTEANTNIRKGVEPKLLESERTTQQQLDAIEKRRIELLNNSTPPKNLEQQLANLKTEEATLLTQYRDIQTKIRTTSPEYAALTQPQALTVAQIQQQLDNDTVLLEYSLGEESSYLWVVSKTALNSYKLPKQATIEAAAKTFRNALTAPSVRYNPSRVAAASQALSKIILAPTTSKLDKKRLVIVSEGALQYIPFAALSLSKSGFLPLINEHEIVTLPSASTITALRSDKITKRKPAPKALAIFADPVFSREDDRIKQAAPTTPIPITQIPIDLQLAAKSIAETGIKSDRLPQTRTEAEQILKLVPKSQSSYLFDFSASRDAAINPDLSQYRIVHFATHGILNNINPELSGVVLSLVDDKGVSQNGFLRLHDIYNLNLPADLVVLSACRTGLGASAKGEGLVGLTRGFMYAGSPRVVVSLWSVDDRATAELMTRFYKGILENKLQPATALRKAQLEMSQLPQWKSPYNWAGFVLQGEWK